MATKYVIANGFFGGTAGKLDNIDTVAEGLTPNETIALVTTSDGDFRFNLKEAADSGTRTSNFPEVTNNVRIIHDDSSSTRYWECFQSPKAPNLISNSMMDFTRTRKVNSIGTAVAVTSASSGVLSTTNTQGVVVGNYVCIGTVTGANNLNSSKFVYEVVDVVTNTSITLHDPRVTNWNTTDTFTPETVVLNSGTFYRCLRTNTNTATSNTTYWAALAGTNNIYNVSLEHQYKVSMVTTDAVTGEYTTLRTVTTDPTHITGKRGLELVCDGNGTNAYYFIHKAAPGDTNFSATYSDVDLFNRRWSNMGVHLYEDKYLTFGAWVYGTNAYLSLDTDLDTEVTSTAKSGLNWHEITIKTSAGINKFIAAIKSSSSTASETDYVSQPMLVEGYRIGSGNFARKPDDKIVSLITTKSNSHAFGTTRSDVEQFEVDVFVDSGGGISRDVFGATVALDVTTTGTVGDHVTFSSEAILNGPSVVTATAGDTYRAHGDIFLGRAPILEIVAHPSTTLSTTWYFNSVYL